MHSFVTQGATKEREVLIPDNEMNSKNTPKHIMSGTTALSVLYLELFTEHSPSSLELGLFL